MIGCGILYNLENRKSYPAINPPALPCRVTQSIIKPAPTARPAPRIKDKGSYANTYTAKFTHPPRGSHTCVLY